ncbi:hypothetical protein FHY15_000480 [Xanthomonas arboricola]|nr:hypothetical protein [Xanthomonas arboricola]NJC02927.1 hypothetical protein [Xanthomonas arboricola]
MSLADCAVLPEPTLIPPGNRWEMQPWQRIRSCVVPLLDGGRQATAMRYHWVDER